MSAPGATPGNSAAFTGAMRILAGLLEARTGQILSESRIWRIETALKPVLRMNGMANLEELVSQLLASTESNLTDDVINALLNNETSFFRDLQTFDMLYRDLLPQLSSSKQDKVLRIWCAGCSTGQEAYSLAMQLRKDAGRWQGWRIQILATDISTAAISRAQSGLFSQIDVQRGLAINDLLRWFEPVGDDWKVSDELRRMIEFRVDNLLEPKASSGDYDLILCRNVMLYFSLERRQKVFSRLAEHSRQGSYLILGAGETVIGQTDAFAASRSFRGSYERSAKTEKINQPVRKTG
ncbi:protein-glutamate O-methyltransferase CheR [Sphingobium phenoxybenzoativorans]|uniref:Protein-glutamate O-methyltransferase CheR n=1 Tax=Sphingobium phenoxybenzoativorans TaxID=1592790 RepID=A0A975K3G2_9SPHN|nr:protein-glutamate O-methyltransferase CheR [Sphingobium phenoxybenzoativorans]QUT04201.1 protein-glutamate O-methyltransferase CheR [Sphingobium phenoxybenzoativorans]